MEEKQNSLLNELRKSRIWSFIIIFAGLFLIAFLTWKFVFRDPFFKHRGFEIHLITYSLIILGVFRYILFIRQQSSLSKNNGRSTPEKIEKYYQRGFYFWLFEAIMTVAVMCFFLYEVYDEF